MFTTSRQVRLAVDRDDVDPRHHDLVHLGLAEPEDAVEQDLLVRRHLGLGGHHLLELFGDRLAVFVILRRTREQRVEPAIDAFAEHNDGRQRALDGHHQLATGAPPPRRHGCHRRCARYSRRARPAGMP